MPTHYLKTNAFGLSGTTTALITPRHASWLRIYAIKLEPGIYVITGGAIKLTRTMQEREHTLVELARMEKVRRFLLDNDIADKDSFVDYLNELK